MCVEASPLDIQTTGGRARKKHTCMSSPTTGIQWMNNVRHVGRVLEWLFTSVPSPLVFDDVGVVPLEVRAALSCDDTGRFTVNVDQLVGAFLPTKLSGAMFVAPAPGVLFPVHRIASVVAAVSWASASPASRTVCASLLRTQAAMREVPVEPPWSDNQDVANFQRWHGMFMGARAFVIDVPPRSTVRLKIAHGECVVSFVEAPGTTDAEAFPAHLTVTLLDPACVEEVLCV
jgi:hypothetical protein